MIEQLNYARCPLAALLLLILAFQVLPALSFLDEGHAHGEDAFEWAGIFETPDSEYLWSAQKVKADDTLKYADATMKMAVIPASVATEAVLHSLGSAGNHALGMNCIDVVSGSTITPEEDKCYRLVFKQTWWQTLYSINASGQGALAFFTEHFPTEFENNAHYLKDDQGDDIEPLAELPEQEELAAVTIAPPEEEKHWGAVIGSALLVNLCTLMGIILLVPALSRAAKTYTAEFEVFTSGFAAGAIAACAFFLLLYEATHLIASAHTEEVDQIWRWGTMILAGAIFPVCTHLVPELVMGKASESKSSLSVVPGDQPSIAFQASRARVISSVLIGDFMHNLCDGFFVGAAFKSCGSSFGWTVAGSTIAHELPQELADYVVLTGVDCALSPFVALLLNFLSGTGVLLGAMIVLSVEVSNGDIGLLLCFGGGVYLYIAFVECLPKLQSPKVSTTIRAIGICLFFLGAILIGLVLLDHEHCVPPPPPGAPAPKAGGHHH